MKDSIRLEDFSTVKQEYLYYCAYNSDGKAAVFNMNKELIFYEDFGTSGELRLRIYNVMWEYLFYKYEILPIGWCNSPKSIRGLYSLKEHSYIIPLKHYSYFKVSNNNDLFIIGDGTSFYFISEIDDSLSIQSLSLDVSSEILLIDNQIVIFRQQTDNYNKERPIAAYSLKEKKVILSFDLEFDMIYPYSFGMIVSKNNQMGNYSYSGDILMPLSKDSLKLFTLPSNSTHSNPQIDLIEKSRIINGQKYTGLYTYDNQCIIPKKFKDIYPFNGRLVIAENHNLSYTVYSIEKRKSIIPPSLGVMDGEVEDTIRAINYFRCVGKKAHFEVESVRGHNCGDYTKKQERFKEAEYTYLISYDLYSYDGELLQSDMLDKISSANFLFPCYL